MQKFKSIILANIIKNPSKITKDALVTNDKKLHGSINV